MTLNYADVGEILKMIDSSSCAEVVLELDGIKLVVRKGGQGATVTEQIVTEQTGTPIDAKLVTQKNVSGSPVSPVSAGSAESAGSTDQGALGGEVVKSPMVGTYYSKPSPEDAAFVVVGQTVKKGDTLCLIEVMKLFTSVEATVDGKVEAIFAEDGALVEFDQPLLSIG
jgi:acetyl-CoA carboxylase biotin carboxyl carrier protein